jgi:hypothetical protein
MFCCGLATGMLHRAWVSGPLKDYNQGRTKNGFKASVEKRYAPMARSFFFLWLTPYAFKTLRSDGEQLNGNQVPESLVAVTHCEFSSGVNHWRTCCASAGLAERLRHILTSLRFVPVFLGNFLWELLTRNLTATT